MCGHGVEERKPCAVTGCKRGSHVRSRGAREEAMCGHVVQERKSCAVTWCKRGSHVRPHGAREDEFEAEAWRRRAFYGWCAVLSVMWARTAPVGDGEHELVQHFVVRVAGQPLVLDTKVKPVGSQAATVEKTPKLTQQAAHFLWPQHSVYFRATYLSSQSSSLSVPMSNMTSPAPLATARLTGAWHGISLTRNSSWGKLLCRISNPESQRWLSGMEAGLDSVRFHQRDSDDAQQEKRKASGVYWWQTDSNEIPGDGRGIGIDGSAGSILCGNQDRLKLLTYDPRTPRLPTTEQK